MTRFEREINGSLGDFWKKNAEEEVKKAVAQADEKATVDEDGAVRWKSNGRCLMDDFCEKLEYAGYPFSREATARKRDAQNEESIAEYRRNHRGLSGEALAEARAAFGEGATVVNILTPFGSTHIRSEWGYYQADSEHRIHKYTDGKLYIFTRIPHTG